ncbi:Uncharacterised protein [uncultured archaeon]|nr:Uncharacterised protein [uncultured archaeon]
MSESKTIALLLGAMLYAIGIAFVNFYAEPFHTAFITHPALELAAVSLGVFFLSSFFWGRLSFSPMLFAGIWFGGLFPQNPIYVSLAMLPMLYGIWGGSKMGENAHSDFTGAGNLFEEKGIYFSAIAMLLVLSAGIGLLCPGLGFDTIMGPAREALKPFGLS